MMLLFEGAFFTYSFLLSHGIKSSGEIAFKIQVTINDSKFINLEPRHLCKMIVNHILQLILCLLQFLREGEEDRPLHHRFKY